MPSEPTAPILTPRKLIEVALPLDAINVACVREKSIRHGHPSTLHLWWARRPLAAARAVLFAQMVNDPSAVWYLKNPGQTPPFNLKGSWAAKRKQLFAIITELVQWESTNKEPIIKKAREEILKSWRETCELNKDHPQATELFNPDKLPAFHDPFAGGGAIPLEAQRLGLEAWASDLNPVAILINKAMIEIPPKFARHKPVGPVPPDTSGKQKAIPFPDDWPRASGLAEDVRRYGHWMREEAFRRIGHLYPKVTLPDELGGGEATVIAWIWARTVKSPNPAFSHVDVPLASTFYLSTKKGKETWIEPIIEGDCYRFTIRTGTPTNAEAVKSGTKLARGANFRCLLSNTPIEPAYIKAEGIAGRMGQRLMAVVAEGVKGRVYLEPTEAMEETAKAAEPNWRPETELPNDPRNFWTLSYGLTKFGDLFTPRQLVALTTFSDLVQEARSRVLADAILKGYEDDGLSLEQGGTSATAYADAVAIYLAFAVDKVSNLGSTICSWMSDRGAFRETFARQAIPMVWDFAESNPFSNAAGNLLTPVEKIKMCIDALSLGIDSFSCCKDAQTQAISQAKIISTDPPYYDNIGYADLSDFFYVWLRKSLKSILPELLSTMAVPKAQELVATPYRHGTKQQAETFFLEGMKQAMHNLAIYAHPAFPITIYYAYKQSDTKNNDNTSTDWKDNGTNSTGWETFLEAVIKSSLSISGTWPVRTEGSGRILAKDTNALASSIVLVCRPKAINAETINRRQFIAQLRTTFADALEAMTDYGLGGDTPKTANAIEAQRVKSDSNSPLPDFPIHFAAIAPVDLAQAAIGPGMGIYSRYAAVLEADGTQMSVRTALTLINKAIDEFFSEAEGELDADTRFCVAWFDTHGWEEKNYGEADVLARAKGTSVDGLKQAGVIDAQAGKVRLRKVSEYEPRWDPQQDHHTPVWEALHYLIRALDTGGEREAGRLLSHMHERTTAIRQLSYRLYTLCERKGWAEQARAYNELITAWADIEKASYEAGRHNTQLPLNLISPP